MIVEVDEPVRLDREFVQDPARAAPAPPHRGTSASGGDVGGVRAWGVTRYAEARALLNDPRLSKDQARAMALFPPGTDGSHASSLNVNMLLKDPPDHTRLRQLASKACTARTVE
jgi:cytochrome P450